MRFTEAGKQIRESTKETDYALALVAHARRLQGQQQPAKDTVGHLLDGLVLDYQLNGQNMKFVHQWVENHLRKFFGDMKITAVTKETIRDLWWQKPKRKAAFEFQYQPVHRSVETSMEHRRTEIS